MNPRGAARSRTALITGASSGIGDALAKVFSREGYDLVLVARNAQKLAEVATELQRQRSDAMVTVMPTDLARPQASEELVGQLERDGITVDILVNNAGFGTHGSFAAADLCTQLEMVQVNVVALTHLTRLFLPGMVRRGGGKILNVASTAAFQPGPLMAVYYASKAYVLSFSEALANELQGTGVSVTALCPGPTRTAFQRRAGVEETSLMQGGMMEAEAVAQAGYRALMEGRPVIIPGARNRLLALAVKFLPRALVTRAVRAIQEQRERV